MRQTKFHMHVKGKVHPRTGHGGPQGEQIYSSTLSLTSALDAVRGRRHVPGTLLPGKKVSTPCTGGWLGPRIGVDGYGKSRLQRDSTPGPSTP
jgi:hypothetical protein